MKRTVILAKRAALWEAGDAARSIAVVEKGKLGVINDKGLIGVMFPGMIAGESAVFTLAGEKHVRTASVFALVPETTVTEYSIFLVKQALDAGRYDFAQEILLSLVVQTTRNLELAFSVNEHRKLVSTSVKPLLDGLTKNYEAALQSVTTWDEFFVNFRYLHHLRDFSQEIRGDLVKYDDRDEIERTSQSVQERLKPVAPAPFGEDGPATAATPDVERFDTGEISDRAKAREKVSKIENELHRFME